MDELPPDLPIDQTTWEELPEAFRRILLAVVQHYERRIEAIEAQLQQAKQTPRNSSRPPSSQHPHAGPSSPSKPGSSGRQGGQPGHRKSERALVDLERVDEVITLTPGECRHCRHSLSGRDVSPLRHQVWELPEIKPIITEYQRHRLACACCGRVTCAELPSGVPTGQSGPRLVAFVSLMMAYFRQSKRRTALFVESISNIPCSSGLTVKHQKLTTQALLPCLEELRSALPQAKVVHCDETATKQAGNKAWIWGSVTSRLTLFAVRLSRGAEVVRELVGESYPGVIVCDRYNGYHGYHRQFCWSHLKRDFQAMIDAGGAAQQIGQRLMDVARELFRQWRRAREGTIARTTMVRQIHQLKGRVWNALEDGMRCGHTKTAGTCRHVFARFDALWTFLSDEAIEPTNNAAERALRHAVIWRKLSLGTQSAAGSRFVETPLSVIETCRQQDRNVLNFVTAAVESHFASQHPASLLDGA